MTDRHLGLTPLGQTEAHGVQLVSLLGPEMCWLDWEACSLGKSIYQDAGEAGACQLQREFEHGHVPSWEIVLKPLR